jgi:hypothetical protein
VIEVIDDIQAQRRADVQEGRARFQPIILVIAGSKRLECDCGAIATFLNVKLNDEGTIEGYMPSCHDCYCKEEQGSE